VNQARQREALWEIIHSINRIDTYARTLHSAPDMGLDAIKYQLVVIGEAVSRLSEQTRSQAPEIPWDRIKSQRNVLVHAYDDVDRPRVLMVVERHLGPLRSAIQVLLSETATMSDPPPSVVAREGGSHGSSDTSTAPSAGPPRHLPGVEEGPGSPRGGAGSA
jgi:uncharacterized protein with HEPN domain